MFNLNTDHTFRDDDPTWFNEVVAESEEDPVLGSLVTEARTHFEFECLVRALDTMESIQSCVHLFVE